MTIQSKIPRQKITRQGMTLAQVYKFSKKFYYKRVDDKAKRMKLDVIGAKLTARQHYEYDPSAKEWKQVEGLRHTKFTFMVSSKPVSYKKTDTIGIHKYPVFFLFYDLTLGWDSPIRWRTGSFKKVLFAKKGASKEDRERVANKNILNGRQLDFFFKLEELLSRENLLYGPSMTNRQLPLKANPSMSVYLDKTALFCVEKVIRHLLSKKGMAMIKGKVFK